MAGAFPSRPSRGSYTAGAAQSRSASHDLEGPLNGTRETLGETSSITGPETPPSARSPQPQQHNSPNKSASPVLAAVSEAAGRSRRMNGHADPVHNFSENPLTFLNGNHGPGQAAPVANGLGKAKHLESQPESLQSTRQQLSTESKLRNVTEPDQCQGAAPCKQHSKKLLKRMSDGGSQGGASALSHVQAAQPDSSAAATAHNHIAARSSSGEAVLANAAGDAGDVASNRGNGAGPSRGLDSATEPSCSGSRKPSAVPHDTLRNGSLSVPDGDATAAISIDKGALPNGGSALPDPASLADMLQDFITQLGYKDLISIRLKDASLHDTSRTSPDVLIERAVSGIGSVKLQRSQLRSDTVDVNE